jgi:nitrite reductase/ring-hydroxylating ferredoxin subunit
MSTAPTDGVVTTERVTDDAIRVRVGGTCVRAAAVCPHRKGRMVHGYVSAGKLHITCPLHYSTFDLLTGSVLAGPATAPLAVTAGDEQR